MFRLGLFGIKKCRPRFNIFKLLKSCSNGDKLALRSLGVDCGFEYDVPPRFNPGSTNKAEPLDEIIDVIFFVEAANRLYLDKVEQMARTELQHMIHSYFCLFDKFPNIERIYNGQNLSQKLLEMLQELCRAFDNLKSQAKRPNEDEEECSGGESEEECQNEDDSWAGEESSDTETQSSDRSDRKLLPSSPPPKKKRKPTASPSVLPKSEEKKSPPLPSKRSYHKKKSCPVEDCTFYGNDL